MRIGKRDFLKALFTLEVSGRPADAGACRCRNAIVDPRDVIGGLLFLRRRLHRYASPSGNIGQPIGSRRNRYRAGVGEFAVYRLDGDDCRPLCQRRDKAGLIDRSDQRLVGRPSQSLIGCALRCNRRIQLAGSAARNQFHRLWSQRDPRDRSGYDSLFTHDLNLCQLETIAVIVTELSRSKFHHRASPHLVGGDNKRHVVLIVYRHRRHIGIIENLFPSLTIVIGYADREILKRIDTAVASINIERTNLDNLREGKGNFLKASFSALISG